MNQPEKDQDPRDILPWAELSNTALKLNFYLKKKNILNTIADGKI